MVRVRVRRAAGAAITLLALAGALSLWPRGAVEHQDASSPDGRSVLVAEGGAQLPPTQFYGRRDCIGNPTTCVNGAGGIVLTYVVAGSPPVTPVAATVLTDENCEPDRSGVSHCINRLRLASGRTLTVRHDHNMGNRSEEHT